MRSILAAIAGLLAGIFSLMTFGALAIFTEWGLSLESWPKDGRFVFGCIALAATFVTAGVVTSVAREKV